MFSQRIATNSPTQEPIHIAIFDITSLPTNTSLDETTELICNNLFMNNATCYYIDGEDFKNSFTCYVETLVSF